MSKVCRKCGGPGPFYRDRQSADGLKSWCQECTKERVRQWQLTNPEAYRAKAKRYGQANREKVRRRNAEFHSTHRDYLRLWKVANPGKVLLYRHLRRVRETSIEQGLTNSTACVPT